MDWLTQSTACFIHWLWNRLISVDVTLFQRGNLSPFPRTSSSCFRSAYSHIRHGLREKLQLQIINYHITTRERTASSYSCIITASFCITCHVWSWLHAEVLGCIMFFCYVSYSSSIPVSFLFVMVNVFISVSKAENVTRRFYYFCYDFGWSIKIAASFPLQRRVPCTWQINSLREMWFKVSHFFSYTSLNIMVKP